MPLSARNNRTEGLPDRPVFAGNDLLDALSQAVRSAALGELEEVRLEEGQKIVSPESLQSSIYFPIDSVISEYQILKDGKTIEVAMTGGEGVAGIQTVFDPQPSPHFAEVIVAGAALRADTKSFRKAVRSHGELRNVLFDYQNAHTAQISRRVVCSNFHTTEERLCLWLMMVRDRTGLTDMPFTQEQIAKYLGVHRPSVTVALQSMNDEGLIGQERGKVCIREPERLASSACGCYSELRVDRELS